MPSKRLATIAGIIALLIAGISGAVANSANADYFCKNVYITPSGSGPVGTTLTEFNDHSVCWPAYTNLLYFWKRDGVNIPGATAQSYTTTSADIGHTIVVHVSGYNPTTNQWLAQESLNSFVATAPSGGTPGIGALAYGGHLPSVSNLNSYSMVIGSSWSSDTSLLASAAGRSLTYFDGTDVAVNYSTGVPYADASANGWLLKDSAGNYLRNSTYGDYAGDLGNSAYQAEWIANVENYLAAHPGLDGVFIDNVFPTPKGDFGEYPAKYPTAASYTAATLSFLNAVYPALHAKGYYVALNAGAYDPSINNYDDGTATVNWWNQVGPYGDGLMNENYQETSTSTRQLRALGTAWYQHWDGWQRLVNVAQSQGKDFIGLMETTGFDTAHAVYGKASFMLEWNGGGSAYIYNCAGTCDPTDASWTQNIGTPVGAKFAVGVGFERAYTAGTVLVNPSATASQTFTVNGTSYTLAPTTAKILAG